MPIVTRGFYISLLAVVFILGLGVLFFRGDEAASQVTVVVALVVGVALLTGIDHYDHRHNRYRQESNENLSALPRGPLRATEKRRAIREAVALWEDEQGPIGEEAREWARMELRRAFGEGQSSTPKGS